MMRRRIAALAVFAALGLGGTVHADEGMWVFNNLPLRHLKERYGFEPTPEWVERLRSSLEESLTPESVSVVAGVGRTPGAQTTPFAAMREATRAAEIAASMPLASPAALHFARLGALRLIFHLADNPELLAFQRDVLGPLEISDATRRSEFVRTLDAFLRAGGNHMRAARDLSVHRNTLIYRLERIQELLGGADLEDPEARLNLQLALKIRAALGGSAASIGAT